MEQSGTVVHVVTTDDGARACPGCGVFATRRKDYRFNALCLYGRLPSRHGSPNGPG